MKVKCPKCSGGKHKIIKTGYYFRKSDSRKIQRFHCKACKNHFSRATFSLAYQQNKRRLNHSIYIDYCSNTSMRRMALKYKVSRTTIARKVHYLSLWAREKNKKWIEEKVFNHVQFDDLETIEHTKLKPVTVTLFVDKQRKILDFAVARIPAKGHLAKLSRRKYGFRPSEAAKTRAALFKRLTSYIDPQSLIESDEHPHYRALVKEYFPRSEHKCFKGEKPCVSGQGELKKKRYDPLFRINHTFAMLRANIHRLVRRTWNTTKNLEALEDQIHIYMHYHNNYLTK